MRISDWSSDVCSSDLSPAGGLAGSAAGACAAAAAGSACGSATGAAGSSCWVVWNIGGYSSGRVDAVDDELDDAARAFSVIGGQHGVDAALALGRAGEAAHALLETVLDVSQFFEDAPVDGGVAGRSV